jgi:hypothetical protein
MSSKYEQRARSATCMRWMPLTFAYILFLAVFAPIVFCGINGVFFYGHACSVCALCLAFYVSLCLSLSLFTSLSFSACLSFRFLSLSLSLSLSLYVCMLAIYVCLFFSFFSLNTVRYGINGVYFYGPLATGNCDRSNLKLSKVPVEVYTTYQYVLPLHLSRNKA